jgi:hypothetical protein
MAVVQISRIQHRRGRKLAGSGMPQLSSAELGWAVDTQELFIGNGSVSEGAPYVGNTKILTENDNLFDLASTYVYKRDNPTVWGLATPTERSLVDRLDESVSIKAFGALGNGVSDDTVAIQTAMDELYLGGEVKNRVALHFPAGEYLVSSSVKIPPYATIIGAGKDKTIFKSEAGTVFETVNGDSTVGSYNQSVTTSLYAANGNQARYVNIQGCTIQTNGNATAFKMVDCSQSEIRDVKFKGPWMIATSGLESSYGLEMITTGVASCQNNRFLNCEFDGFDTLVYSDYDIHDNVWENCIFYMASNGFAGGINTVLGRVGQTTGPKHNTIRSSKFDFIAREGINILAGEYNTSSHNRFFNVGNDGGNSSQAISPIIEFSSWTNVSDADFFQRTVDLTPNSVNDAYYAAQYIPEVHGTTQSRTLHGNKLNIGQKALPYELLKFPLIHGTFFIDYMYSDTFNGLVREGTLTLTLNQNLNTATIQDEYTYAGPSVHQDTLTWTTSVQNYGTFLGANPDTAVILVENTLGTNTDHFTYVIRSKT